MGKIAWGKFHHAGIVVRDMDKAVKYFESLGLGPFEPLWAYAGQLGVAEGMFRGKPYSAKVTIRTVEVGGIELEFIQPVSGESINQEFLQSKGEGVAHLGFEVANIAAAEKELAKKGLEVIFRLKFLQGGGCAFYNTNKVGGVIFEVFQPPPRK